MGLALSQVLQGIEDRNEGGVRRRSAGHLRDLFETRAAGGRLRGFHDCKPLGHGRGFRIDGEDPAPAFHEPTTLKSGVISAAEL